MPQGGAERCWARRVPPKSPARSRFDQRRYVSTLMAAPGFATSWRWDFCHVPLLRCNGKARRSSERTSVRVIAWKTEIRDGEVVLSPAHEVVLGKGHGGSRTQLPGFGLIAFHFCRVGEIDRWIPDGIDSEV